MSGELAVGVAVVAVGGAWLAARGIEAGALVAARSVDLLGAGLIRIGDHAALVRSEWERSHAATAEWEAAAREVIDVNARLDVLRAQPDLSTDLLTALPAVLAPAGQSPAALRAWCEDTRQRMLKVEREMVARSSRAVRAVLRHSVDESRPVTADEAFAHYRAALSARAAEQETAAPSVVEAVANIVGRMAVDAGPTDRAAVLAAAAQVSMRRPDVDHEILLDELRLRVQRADERAKARREDAVRAATMLAALAGEPDPELPGIRDALAEVVAGRGALDRGLRARAEQTIAQVRLRLEREYVRGSVTSALAELGYDVDEDFSTTTGAADRVRLVRDDWSEHAVQVVVEGDEVKAAVIRVESASGDDARRQDIEREEQWCRDLEAVRASLEGAGVQVQDRRLTPPGQRVPPVAKRGSSRSATRPNRRERSR